MPRKRGIIVTAKGIRDLNISSTVNEFAIQYVFEKKYVKPNVHPYRKDEKPFLISKFK